MAKMYDENKFMRRSISWQNLDFSEAMNISRALLGHKIINIGRTKSSYGAKEGRKTI